MSPGPSACEADVIPLHHEPIEAMAKIKCLFAKRERRKRRPCSSSARPRFAPSKTPSLIVEVREDHRRRRPPARRCKSRNEGSRGGRPTRTRGAPFLLEKGNPCRDVLRILAPRVVLATLVTDWLSYQIRCSIVVSISACHAEDPGSIPGGGVSCVLPGKAPFQTSACGPDVKQDTLEVCTVKGPTRI